MKHDISVHPIRFFILNYHLRCRWDGWSPCCCHTDVGVARIAKRGTRNIKCRMNFLFSLNSFKMLVLNAVPFIQGLSDATVTELTGGAAE